MRSKGNAVYGRFGGNQGSSEPDGTMRLLDSAETKSVFGNRSDMWLWRRIKDGTLPKPLIISGRRYWRADEIDELITRLSEERAGAYPR